MGSNTFRYSLCLLILSCVEAANILGVFTMNSPSHNIIHISIVKALANAGHNLTVVTMLPLKDKNPNYHHIYVPTLEEDKQKLAQYMNDLATANNIWKSARANFAALDFMNDIQQKALQGPEIQELLNNKGNHFDLMIFGYGYNDYHLGIADHFKCPIIVSWVNVPMLGVNDLVGNPEGVSYVSKPWLGAGRMGFFKRVANFISTAISETVLKFRDIRLVEYYELNFPQERGYRPLEEMRKNISLMFCSTFFSEGTIRPAVPAFIEIGGIQAKEIPDPLPKDIDDFLKLANHGFIFFSLGSNLKSTDLTSTATRAIFKVLSKRKERVLWKWDAVETPGEASNILFSKWFPQDDILAHPKIKLFMTHGGKGSITEAQYHGVPLLALPVFGDQSMNARIMQSQGYGLILDHQTLTEDTLRAQLDEILNNSTYFQTINQFSKLYRDRPMTPRQSVVYWTEYVLRHKGAKHMQSPKVHLNGFQYNSFDVIALLFAIGIAIFYCAKLSVCFVIGLLHHRNQSKLKKKAE